jgi:hypothetical protein
MYGFKSPFLSSNYSSSKLNWFGDLGLAQLKVAVKQSFSDTDAVMFDVALVLNAIETQHKQKAYVS